MAKKDTVLNIRMDAKLYAKIKAACGNQGMKVSQASRLLFTAWLCNGGHPQELFPHKNRILKRKYLEYLDKRR